jgi:hypothetical protein
MVEAIERYRQAGRRWYLLYDKLYAKLNLKAAWEQVEENGGAAGVSGQTIAQYRDGLEQRLADLAQKLKEQSFDCVRRDFSRRHLPAGISLQVARAHGC